MVEILNASLRALAYFLPLLYDLSMSANGNYMRSLVIILALVASTSITLAESTTRQATELGTVSWSRDLHATLEASEKSGKPVLLLFQEVPG